MKKRKQKRTRNPFAKALIDPLFRNRKIKSKKGKGSYERFNTDINNIKKEEV